MQQSQPFSILQIKIDNYYYEKNIRVHARAPLQVAASRADAFLKFEMNVLVRFRFRIDLNQRRRLPARFL
jgi:hypothetical protein